MPFTSFVAPESKQFAGVARETTAGTPVAPVITIPADKIDPGEQPDFLPDNAIRGSMADGNYGLLQGTEIGSLDLSGPVYMDTIGYLLHNIFGDYTTTGTASTPTFVAATGAAAGATTITITSATAATAGTFIQVGTATGAEVVTVGTGSTTTSIVLSASTPLRLTHTGSTTITTVVAPFTHVFTLLNSATGQPVTHTMTHYQGLSATTLARVYPYWCASELTFTIDSQKLFEHAAKGTSILSTIAGSAPTNTLSGTAAQPAWRTLVGIAGPASGGTLISDPLSFELSITRKLKPLYTLSGQQAPFIIGRAGLAMSAKMTQLAQSETPLLNMLNNVQPQLQVVVTNGGTGASLLSCTFDLQQAAYKTTKLNAQDEIQYDTDISPINNNTNVGNSGGFGPGKVTLINAVPTY